MKDFIKKYYKNFIIVFILGLAVYLYILLKHDAKGIINQLKNMNFLYIILALLIFIIYVALEALVLHLFTKSKVKGVNIIDSFRLNLSTQFFNNITPFAAGGQPFQIFYLTKRGIKVKDSSSIVLMNYITYVIAFDIVGAFCLIWKYAYFNEILAGKGYLLLIGYGVNIFVTLLVIFLAFSKKIYHIIIEVIWMKIVYWKILRRFKLEKKTAGIKQTINDFNKEIKELNKHKGLWVISVILHITRIIVVYTIPLIIFMALGQVVSNQVINLIIAGFFVAMVMSYVPLPGASGGAEGFFGTIFIAFISDESVIIAAMFMWRFITYYLFIFFGFLSLITLNFDQNLKDLNYEEEEYLVKTVGSLIISS